MMSRRIWLFALVLVCGMARAALADTPMAINMIVDDKTVLFYAGGDQGIKVGDVFDVTRDGSVVGQVKAKKVGAQFTYATIISGAVKEMDSVIRAASAPPVEKIEKIEKVEKVEKVEEVEEPEPKPEPKKKLEEKLEQPVKIEEAPAKKPEPRSQPKKERTSATHSSILGLTGAVYTPTAIATPQGTGEAQFGWLSAENEKLQYRDMIFGVNYGVSKDIELGGAYTSTTPTNPGATGTLKTLTIAFKYSLPNVGKSAAGNASQIVYALGAYYYRQQGYTPTVTGGTSQNNATRVFGVATMKASGGDMSLTAYTQNGGILRDTGYEGFGFSANYEHPFGGLGKQANGGEAMTLVTEFDTKAFYVGIRNCWTLGMRYRFGQRAHIGVNVVGLGRVNAPFIGGGFNF